MKLLLAHSIFNFAFLLSSGTTLQECVYSYYIAPLPASIGGGDAIYSWEVGYPEPTSWGDTFESYANPGPFSVQIDKSTFRILGLDCGISQPLPPQPGDPPPQPDRATPRAIGAGTAPPSPAVPNPNYPPSGTPRGDNPNTIPHAGLAPGINPNPTQTPSNLGGNLPQSAPTPTPQLQPTPQAPTTPDTPPTPGQIVTPSTDNNDRAFPQFKPAFSPTPLTPSPGFTPTPMLSGNLTTPAGGQAQAKPSALPGTSRPSSPTPDSNKPSAPPVPSVTPDSGILKQLQDNQAQINVILTTLAALTIAVKGIPGSLASDPGFQQAAQNAAATGTCKTTQPGGCTANQFDNTNNKIDGINDKLNGLNTGLNSAALALLNTINSKLGDLIPGGLSGALTKFFDWNLLDRTVNLLNLAMTIQMVEMMSMSLEATTLTTISHVLGFFGLKDKDGNDFPLEKIVNGGIESLLKQALGVDKLNEIKKDWAVFNRIVNSSANLMFAIQNVAFQVQFGMDTLISYTGQIGEALKKYRAVGHNAYQSMVIGPNFHNRIFGMVNGAFLAVTNIQMIASTVDALVSSFKSVDTSAGEIVQDISGTPPTSPPENKPNKDATTKAEGDSKSPSITQDILNIFNDL